jgi:hypothetical protein
VVAVCAGDVDAVNGVDVELEDGEEAAGPDVAEGEESEAEAGVKAEAEVEAAEEERMEAVKVQMVQEAEEEEGYEEAETYAGGEDPVAVAVGGVEAEEARMEVDEKEEEDELVRRYIILCTSSCTLSCSSLSCVRYSVYIVLHAYPSHYPVRAMARCHPFASCSSTRCVSHHLTINTIT